MSQRPVLMVLGGLVAAAPAHAQRVSLRSGNTVRITSADSGVAALWQAGTVLTATRIGVLIRTRGGPRDTVPVPLNGSMRVQLQRRPNRNFFLGSSLGAIAGGVLGATALRSTFGAGWSDPGVGIDVVTFGLLGGVLGGAAGLVARPVRWEEIPVSSTGLLMTPLSRPVKTVPLAKFERWREFEPTVADFAAFFAHWKDSLEAIEGVWELDALWSGTAMSRISRVAMVRDGRYEGYTFIAVDLPPRGAPDPLPQLYGVIQFAMRQGERPGTFDVRFTGASRPGVYGDWAEFREGQLEFHFRGQPTTTRWLKLDLGVP